MPGVARVKRRLRVEGDRKEGEAGDSVYEHRLAKGGAFARSAAEVHGRLIVHERQRHKLGDAACAALQSPEAHQVASNRARRFQVPEHERARRPESHLVRGLHHRQPLASRYLVRTDESADFVIEHFCSCARKRAKPGLLELPQEGLKRQLER